MLGNFSSDIGAALQVRLLDEAQRRFEAEDGPTLGVLWASGPALRSQFVTSSTQPRISANRRGHVPPERAPALPVDDAILAIRGYRVLLDADLAPMYGVTVRALNQAVKRNHSRFPPDFMFELTSEETQDLRSQIVISSWGGRRYLPRAFTEQGVAMLSSVLRSERAALVNVEIMRAFVRIRQLLQENGELARKLDALEKKYDAQFRVVFDAIRELMSPPLRAKRPIGFKPDP